MRMRTGGSHHQKFVILRHHDRPALDVAFLGASAFATVGAMTPRMAATHNRSRWPRRMGHDRPGTTYSSLSADQRWAMWRRCSVNDGRPPGSQPQPDPLDSGPCPARQPLQDPLPRQRADPEPAGPHPVQLLRTYPRRMGGYPFACAGERGVARGYTKAVSQARHLIYIEDQCLWSPEVAATLAVALQRNPELHLVAVLPQFPDQNGRLSRPPNLIGRDRAIATLDEVAPGRAAIYGLPADPDSHGRVNDRRLVQRLGLP